MRTNTLLPIPADVLEDMRRLAGKHPEVKPMSFDLNLGKTEDRQRPLSAKECVDLIGTAVAVKMNFIPQMMTALVMQKTIDLINFCITNRLAEFKKHTRTLRRCVEEYAKDLCVHYGDAAHTAYLCYAERYMNLVRTDVYMMILNLQEIAANQIPHKKHREIAAMLSFIVLLIRYCDRYDSEMDGLIESKIGVPVRQQRDVHVHFILDLCLAIAKKYGYMIEPTDKVSLWVKILSNRAYMLADIILAEENVT